LAVFAHRNYRLFFAGQSVSLTGTWMQQVAQAWLVLGLTGDPLALGVIQAVQFLPSCFLGLFAGLLADILPRRQTLIAAQTAMALLAGLLAILTAAGVVQVWMVITLGFLLGCASAVDMPVRHAFVRELVGPEELGDAIALNATNVNVARVVGPAVAGITIALVGVAAAFALNALSFLAVIIGLTMMRERDLLQTPREVVPRTFSETLAQVGEGLRFIRDSPVAVMAISVFGVTATFGMNFNVLFPPLASQVLGTDAAGYGLLMTGLGIGAVASAVAMVLGGRLAPSQVAVGAALLGGATVALALSSLYALSLFLVVLVGIGSVRMATTSLTTIQLAAPDRMRGRSVSVFITVFSASVPLGSLLMGALAAMTSVTIALAVGGTVSLVAGMVGVAWWSRNHP
jgi:predicted MFS family arabinose efflux permease